MTTAPPEPDARRPATMSAARVPALIVGVPTSLALLAALRFPFTASPGAAGAQVLAVVGGLALALAMALRGSARDPRGFRDDARWGAAATLITTAAWALASLVSEALRPACGSSKGLAPFIVLAVPVLLLQGALGAWIGRLTGRTRTALLVTVLAELLAMLALVVGFYLDPTWRIVSHLFVAISTEQVWGSAAPEGVETYRAATLCFALALAAFGDALFPGEEASATRRPRRAWLVGALLLVAGLVVERAARPIVAPTHADLWRAYSMTKSRGPLTMHADPLTVRAADLDVMLAEGTLWLARIDARLGQRSQQTIHVWVHATAADKQRWTGASRADFALPWRHEIHVLVGGAQHHTLGHELVHVIAGEPLTTLFHTPSVWIVGQRLALIEGLAVAITPELKRSDALTVLEEAAALTRIARAPDPEQLFNGLAFLTESHQTAYAAAGAVLGALDAQSNDGGRTLRAVYATGSIAGALGSADKAKRFFDGYRAQLSSLTLPDGALSEVTEQFSEPSTITATCREASDDQSRRARILARNGALTEALAAAGDRSLATLRDLAAETRAVGDTANFPTLARAYLALPDSMSAAERALAAGELFWLADSTDAARTAWHEAPLATAPPVVARALIARAMLGDAISQRGATAPMARAALAMLLRYDLVSSGVEALEVARGLDALDALDAAAASAPASTPRSTASPAPEGTAGDFAVRSLARYLLARRLWILRRPDVAVPMLEQVLRERALPAPFIAEAMLMQVRALASIGRAADALLLRTSSEIGLTRRVLALELADLFERANRAMAAPPRPRLVTATTDPAWADRMLLTPFEP